MTPDVSVGRPKSKDPIGQHGRDTKAIFCKSDFLKYSMNKSMNKN